MLRRWAPLVLVAAVAGSGCGDLGNAPPGENGPPGGNDSSSVSLLPVRDNTLYEHAQGATSNGAGEHLFVGKTGPNAGEVVRRGVLAFDVAAAVPAGATIDSVRLTLHLSNSSTGGPSEVALHRLLAGWGEATSDAGKPGGDGAAAAPGDATWIHAFFDTVPWSTPGGDYSAAPSATTLVRDFVPPDDPANLHAWSGAALVADVQSMLDDPDADFGWILIGDEQTLNSAKRFHTREHDTEANRPRLFVRYRAPDSGSRPFRRPRRDLGVFP